MSHDRTTAFQKNPSGLVIEQIIREAPEFSDFYYYRTQNGAEVDLVIITPSGKKVCIEIKFSVSPAISKGQAPVTNHQSLFIAC